MNVIQKICFNKGKLEVCLNKNTYSFFQKHSVKLFCILCFALVNIYLILQMRPLDQLFFGDDAPYHYLRVEALKYNMENHNLFSGVDYLFFGGAGYASSTGYPDILLYIPAFLRTLGVGIGTSMSMLIILCNIFSYLLMFMCMKKMTNSAVCGTIAAIFYTLASYRLDNIFTRFALGEIQACIFWPLILYGLYNFIFEDFKKPYIIGIGFVGMLLSHTISTAIALGFCVILGLIFIGRILETPRKFITLAITICAVLAVAAFYWIPLLEMINSCKLNLLHSNVHSADCTITLFNLFRDLSIRESPSMGIPIFLMCLPRILLTRNSPIYKTLSPGTKLSKRPNILVAADAFLIFGIILALIATDKAPWKILSKPLDFMQFPWRLFALSTLLLIAGGTICIYYLIHFTNAKKIGMTAVMIVSVLCASVHLDTLNAPRAYHPDDYYTFSADRTCIVCAGEWLPYAICGKGDILELTSRLILSDETEVPFEQNCGVLKFNIENNNSITYAKVPFIWYKGYEATDENGNKLETSMSDNGLVQVNLQGVSGEITVKHKATTIRIISYIISALSIVLLLILFLKKKQKPDIENTKDNNDIKEKNDSGEDSMIKKILSSETCAECRLCCGFDNTDLWELPVIPPETEEFILNQKPETKFVPCGDEKTFDSGHLEDNELFYCPMLSENGCTMGINKPFDCKIWPFRMMKTQEGELCITVAEICNGLSDKSIEELKSFLEEGLADKIFEYAKEHPSHIKDLMPDYKIIIKQ
ncbi:MAG: hypothetical protein IJZ64_09350 [Ruminococcus sp.]|nr:hypothetical protein [Ruminococcus sp.]